MFTYIGLALLFAIISACFRCFAGWKSETALKEFSGFLCLLFFTLSANMWLGVFNEISAYELTKKEVTIEQP
jgi:hypothetical protein